MNKERKEDLPVTYADIEHAAELLEGQIPVTPCNYSHTLSDILGCGLWLKFENLQFTASFKDRGSLNRLSALVAEGAGARVIAMSAGNHAQAVAYHAKNLGIPATIIMPVGTPTVKIENTRRFGAEVIVEGTTLEEAGEFARAHAEKYGLIFIHPYDDPMVIAGQGTIAIEMLQQAPELDTLIVPIGGGGLASGIAIAAKALKPEIELIGVQAALYPSMYNVIKNTNLPMHGDSLAEGIAVKFPGVLTQKILGALLDDIILVDEVQLEHAVSQLLNIEKTVAEGAGAAGVAAISAKAENFAGRNVGTVLCGGNIDTRLLASVLTRTLTREGRLSRLSIEIVDRPGHLAQVTLALAEAGANIVEVAHQRVFTGLPAKAALLDVVIETRDRAHLNETITHLNAKQYVVTLKALD